MSKPITMVTPEPRVCAPSQHFRAVLGDCSLVLLRFFQRSPMPPLLLRSSRSLISVKALTWYSPSPLPCFITSALFTLGRFVLRRLKPFFLINGLTSPPETAISHRIPVKPRIWKAAQIEATPPPPAPPCQLLLHQKFSSPRCRHVCHTIRRQIRAKGGEQNGLEEEQPRERKREGAARYRAASANGRVKGSHSDSTRLCTRADQIILLCCWAAGGDVPAHSPSSRVSSFSPRLFETLQSLFWSIFGLLNLYVTNVKARHEFTEFIGATMFGTYNVISLVVLLNMLIAMMNNSYQLIAVSHRADLLFPNH